MNKAEVAKLCNKQKKITMRGLAGQYENTRTCIEFYNGDTMSYEDRIQFVDEFGRRRRATVQFNKIQPSVDSVGGFMAQNRRQAKYIARLNGSEEQNLYSKYMNAIYDYHRENMNADQIETDQDMDMLINGYGAIESDLSYVIGNATTDPNGEIIKVRLDPMRLGWDPAARGKNILDARWAYYWEDYELKDALDLFQNSKEEDFEKVSDTMNNSQGYMFNPFGGLYDKIKLEDSVEWSSKTEDMVRVYNHQWMQYETFYRADNPLFSAQTPEDALFMQARLSVLQVENSFNGPDDYQSEDMFTFDPTQEVWTFDEKTKSILVKEFGDLLNPVPFKRKCFYTAVYSGTHVFTFFKSICQQGFSIKFKTGVYNASKQFWVGMVNPMMQPAEYHNKALTELMFTIAVNSKGGVMIEEDAVEDIAEFETKWAQTDGVIKVNSGSLSQGKILEKAKVHVPTGLENIIALSDQNISANGVDPSFLGNIEKEDQSGILYKRRIRQVISKFARYFDSITLYQKEDARLMADLIRVWIENNNGAFVRITGEDRVDEFVLINEDKLAAEYDVSIQEAPQSPEDKQETAEVLGMYADKLASVGNSGAASAFYAESLQYLPIDADVRNRLTQALQPQDKVDPAQFAQMQQLVQELMSRQNQVELGYKESQTQLNLAKVTSEQSKLSKDAAETARTLEEAANKGLENDLIRQGKYSEVNVSI